MSPEIDSDANVGRQPETMDVATLVASNAARNLDDAVTRVAHVASDLDEVLYDYLNGASDRDEIETARADLRDALRAWRDAGEVFIRAIRRG